MPVGWTVDTAGWNVFCLFRTEFIVAPIPQSNKILLTRVFPNEGEGLEPMTMKIWSHLSRNRGPWAHLCW